ncbi:hypothetical protein WJX73_008640 [Symbiochloris irregularis]|uniref:Uncharacterized protein n=1 Tax=Symbiochloris irregularis TaxID=706552 RepID=A0AAW1PEI8_9CHLO
MAYSTPSAAQTGGSAFKEATAEQRERFAAAADALQNAALGASFVLDSCQRSQEGISPGGLPDTVTAQQAQESRTPAETARRSSGRATARKAILISDTEDDSQSDASDFESRPQQKNKGKAIAQAPSKSNRWKSKESKQCSWSAVNCQQPSQEARS